jgi:MarR family transcriptional regulator, negative regulator of the multidrug operon emrRAB
MWIVNTVSYRYYVGMNDNLVFDLLERLGGLLRSDNRQIAALHGLQPVHLEVLRFLARCNRYSNTPAAITQYLQSTKGTVSQSINLLVRNGFIAKLGDRDDKRITRLRLLKKGERLIVSIGDTAVLYKAISTLEPTESQKLEVALRKLLRASQALNEYRTFGQCQTCQHFRHLAVNRFQCGLTNETLFTADIDRICVEHEVKVA